MSRVLWDNCRRADRSINLSVAATMTGCKITTKAHHYLALVEKIMDITSRQAAAVAIATAIEMSSRTDD